MTVNKEKLDQLIFQGATFTICGGGFWVRLNNFEDSGYYVKNTDLAQVHPRLPSAIRLLSRLSEPYACYASSYDILMMLKLWQAELCVVASDGTQVAVLKVRDVTLNNEHVCMMIRGFRYETVRSLYDPEPYLIPIQVCTETTVSNRWLDEHYPAWDTRFLLATELGYSADDCVREMLNLPQASTTCMLPGDIMQ